MGASAAGVSGGGAPSIFLILASSSARSGLSSSSWAARSIAVVQDESSLASASVCQMGSYMTMDRTVTLLWLYIDIPCLCRRSPLRGLSRHPEPGGLVYMHSLIV